MFQSKLLFLIIGVAFTVFLSPVNSAIKYPAIESNLNSLNLLVNSDFASDTDNNNIPDGWGDKSYNSKIITDDKNQRIYLQILNTNPLSSIGSQRVSVDGRVIPLLTVSAKIRIKGVVLGGQPWENAKIQLLFFDKSGNQIGGWPEVGSYTGNSDWTPVKKVFQVPVAARSVQVNIGLWNCLGEFDIAGISMEARRAPIADPFEFLVNGGFEIWQGWVYGGSSEWGVVYPGYVGDGMLHINNPVRNWSFASQSMKLDGQVVKKVNLSGYMKLKDVTLGIQPWEQARINIEFRDEHGVRVGGWPIVGEGTGTSAWRHVEGTFDVPPATAKVLLFAGLLNCTGEAWFDEISLRAYDGLGRPVRSSGLVKTNTSDWVALPLKEASSGSVLDLSNYLSAPAGKYGPVTVKDGHFVFQNGERARFLGTDVFASQLFLDKASAEKMAERIAKSGFNLVRIHHLDAAWSNPNIFDPALDDTRHLSKDSLDKVDYFISELEKRGVYIYLDLLVHRGFKKDDGVADYDKLDNGAKVSAFVDKRIIELQKEYASQLLTHTNSYTGKQYLNDPAVAMVDIVNENSLYYIAQLTWLPDSINNKLDELWIDWLKAKYKHNDVLDSAWTGRRGLPLLHETESLENGSVKRSIPMLAKYRPVDERSDARLRDTLQFYYDLEVGYYTDMANYLHFIGLKTPLAGSNHWENIELDIKANTIPQLDFIDRHMYWNHPQFGYGTSVIFDNQSMLKYPGRSIPGVISAQRVKGMPLVVSEWNTAWPGDYYFEGPSIVAPYARLQDVDAIIQFSFNSYKYPDIFSDNFDLSALPNVMSQMQVAAPVFYGRDITPAKTEVCEYINDKSLLGLINEDRGVFAKPELSLVSRVAKTFNKDQASGNLTQFNQDQEKMPGVYNSDSGQLSWNSVKGILTVSGSAVNGAVGFLGKDSLIDSGFAEISSKTGFCSLFLVAKDGKSLRESSKILIIATARAENSGMIYNSDKTQIIDIGDAPLLIECVNAEIKLPVSVPSRVFKVSALDLSGDKIAEVPVKTENNKLVFSIGPEYKTFYYLIER